MTLRTWSAATSLICFLASTAPADVVTVSNGDQLHGTVVKIEKNKLFLKTDYAGTVPIDWEKIQSIEAEGSYEVEVEQGRRFTGGIAREDNRFDVRNEDVVTALRPPDVVAAVRLEADNEPPGFWKTLNGSLGLGYSFSRGNAEQTQSSLTAQGDYRKEKYRLQGDVTSILATQEEAETTSRHALNGRYDRYLSDRAFAFALTSFERNDRQKLDLRSRFGGGFGWKAAKGRSNELDLLGGFTLTNEQFRNGEGEMLPRETTGEGLFGFEWKNTQLRGVRLYTRLTAHPNLVQTGRYRIEYDSKAQVPLMMGFSWTVGLFDRYDSDPPREGVLRNDYGMVSTFGFSF
jgi:hypothetical protein